MNEEESKKPRSYVLLEKLYEIGYNIVKFDGIAIPIFNSKTGKDEKRCAIHLVLLPLNDGEACLSEQIDI
jgi:hypothetical protein